MSSVSLLFVIFTAIVASVSSVGIYEQCAGEGYGTFPCNAGMTCFRRNKWFSSCQYSCPLNLGWECEAYIVPVLKPVANAWDQCGAQGWLGATACPAGFTCYARSVHYSQCRPTNDCPAGWACGAVVAPTTPIAPVPVTLAPYQKCNNVGFSVCPTGTECFRNSDVYSECRPSCPETWACKTDLVSANDQCGGEGYVGLTRCAEGLRCYYRSKWYAQCAASCPGSDWAC